MTRDKLKLYAATWLATYWVVYIFFFPLGSVPGTTWLADGYDWCRQNLVMILGRVAFGLVPAALPNGSGDTTYNYIELVSLGMMTCTLVPFLLRPGSGVSWKGKTRDAVSIYVRYYLGAVMLGYGWHKLIPVQFSPIGPDDCIMSYESTSPMGLLWRFMGASTAYQMFGGGAEVIGGLLLLFRRTSLLGAIISFGVLVNVVMLNFCFDVPVKLYSSHLLGMSVWLIYPHAGRLWNAIVSERAIAARVATDPFACNGVWRAIQVVVQLAFVILFALLPAYQNWRDLFKIGSLQPKTERHGIYRVRAFSVGEETAETNLATRWIRVGWSDEGLIAIQRGDGIAKRFRFELDEKRNAIVLKQRGEPDIELNLKSLSPLEIELSGMFMEQPIRAVLEKLPEADSLINQRGFHWINEQPLNR